MTLLLPPAGAPLAQLAEDGARRLYEAFFASKGRETRRAYEASVALFAGYLAGRRGLQHLEAATAVAELLGAGAGPANLLALEFREAIRARPLSPGSVNRHLSCLRSVVALARTFGMVSWELSVPNLKGAGAYRDTRGPGRSAVRSMLDDLARRPGAKAVRDRALLRLLYDLGLRRFEASGLDVAHVDLVGARVSVLRKGKSERILLSMPAPTVRALAKWLALRGSSPGALFVGFRGGKGKRLAASGVYGAVRKMGRDVGSRVRPHGLRHTAITEACKRAQAAGIGLDEVRQFSGHANVATLMVYRDNERNVQGRIAALVAEDP